MHYTAADRMELIVRVVFEHQYRAWNHKHHTVLLWWKWNQHCFCQVNTMAVRALS